METESIAKTRDQGRSGQTTDSRVMTDAADGDMQHGPEGDDVRHAFSARYLSLFYELCA
jgi:hypothetical protein